MANELYVYAQPLETIVELTLDSGQTVKAHCTSANGRDDAHLLPLPAGTRGQGARLTVTADGRAGASVRGIVHPSDDDGPALFQFDDFGELPLDDEESQPPAPEPEPDEDADPEAIIQAVYEVGDYDLATHDGCGQFTEDCCVQLHVQHSDLWGHIRKNPGQNQYNGHAVDALYLLAGEGAGVYDIIHDSVSPNASPTFNWKDPGDPNLWYYPTGDVVLSAARRGPHMAPR
jgi:hypothetical protein